LPRARFGVARSLAATNRLEEALDMALTASASDPRDGEIHALIGDIYERLRRFAQASNSYRNYINLLPNKDRSEKAAWARAQVDFLDSFGDSAPVDRAGPMRGRSSRRMTARSSPSPTRLRSGICRRGTTVALRGAGR
jgi:tetratricopeptide (TPR) repeat protein